MSGASHETDPDFSWKLALLCRVFVVVSDSPLRIVDVASATKTPYMKILSPGEKSRSANLCFTETLVARTEVSPSTTTSSPACRSAKATATLSWTAIRTASRRNCLSPLMLKSLVRRLTQRTNSIPILILSDTFSAESARISFTAALSYNAVAGSSSRLPGVGIRTGYAVYINVHHGERSKLKLIRFGSAAEEKPGLLLQDGTRVDASALGADYDEAFFAGGGLRELEKWSQNHSSSAPRVPPSVRLGPPICRPSKIVCIGLNFRDHAAESKMDLPKEPVLFFKSTTSLVGPNDPLMIPRKATKVDWEVELAVVIGRKALYVPKDRALDFIAGFVLHNDYSERGFQLERGGQWVKGKSADSFAPLGPWVATPEEIPDVSRLHMWLKVNGELRQNSSTANMIFDVPTLVAYVSEFMTLLPGDIISTGTPAGVGLGMHPPRYLQVGDVVELGIDGLGESRQTVVGSL